MPAIAPASVPSCSRSSSRMSALSRCTWVSMKAGRRRRPSAAGPASTAVKRSPSQLTSAVPPDARRTPFKVGIAALHSCWPEIPDEGGTAMAVAESARERDVVYPEDRLPWLQTGLLSIQHVMAMFGATVLVPLILGFNPNTVIFFSGVATLIFLAVTGFKVPSYLGSSFSFIGSVLAIQGGAGHNQRLAFAGIAIAGAIYFLVGLAIHFIGVNPIRFLMPPVVTGTVVAVIGLALSSVAAGNYAVEPVSATITLLPAVAASVYL